MIEFWHWAKDNSFLAFVLAWVALVMGGKVLLHFLGIFHRRPSVIRLTDDQFEAVRRELARGLASGESNDEPSQEIRVELSPGPRGRPWYERIG